jgi:hypothetical protein
MSVLRKKHLFVLGWWLVYSLSLMLYKGTDTNNAPVDNFIHSFLRPVDNFIHIFLLA